MPNSRTDTTKHKIIRRILVTTVMGLFGLMFVPFFGALLLAGLLAFALHDYIGHLTRRGIRRQHATILMTLGSLVFIAAPFIYIILKAASVVKEYSATGVKGTAIYQSTEKLLGHLSQSVGDLGARFGLDMSGLSNPGELLGKYSDDITAFATGAISHIPDIGLGLFVFFLGLYFFLNEAQKIKNQFLKWDLLSLRETDHVIGIIKQSSRITLVVSILIGLFQASIVATVAYFCGFNQFFIIFIVTAICSLIPVVGSAPMPLFLALIAFVQGNNGIAIIILVAAGVAGTVDNIIKPLVLSSGGEEELHPILSLLTLIGAIIVYGPIGLLVGPIITQLALDLLPTLIPGEKAGENEIPGPLGS